MRLIVSIFFILFSVSQLLFVTPSVYASCLAQTVTEHADNADIIVTGTVSTVSNSAATVLVDRYYKGHGGPGTLVFERGPEITSIDIFLEEEKKYLLYVRIENNTYRTDLCMGSREVTDGLSEDEIAVLGEGREFVPSSLPGNNPPKEPPPTVKNINLFLIAVMSFGAAAVLVYFYRYPRKKKKK
jgi:hypothetical protein